MAILYLTCLTMFYALMGYGAVLCIMAYRRTRKLAWILIFLYCMSAFLGFRFSKFTYPFKGDRYSKLSYSERLEMMMRGEYPKGRRLPTLHISFPIFQLILVLGLFKLTRPDQLGQVGTQQGPLPNKPDA